MKYYCLGLGVLVFVCVGCVNLPDGQQIVKKDTYQAPPPSMQNRPGPMVDGPGPGVLGMMGAPKPQPFATKTTQVRFLNPLGMHIGWKTPQGYAVNQIVAPGRYNFQQGATYRLKLTSLPGRDGLVLYPTLQVYPSHPTTDPYLAHNSVPIEVTEEDLDQIESNNFVTKVIYLPEAKYQELAIAGVETLVSTRLDPGVDPVAEADRRGTIMAVLRVGNMDLEMPGHGGQPNDLPPGGAAAAGGPNGVRQVNYQVADGSNGQHVPPMPIAINGQSAAFGPMGPMIAGVGSAPGGPTYGGQPWGMPITATPIGLPGPPHLPYGRPASLKSHTMINDTDIDVGKPVDHFVARVKHNPGIRMPHPVREVEYTETHPNFSPGEVSIPAWAKPAEPPQQGPYGPGGFAPGGFGPGPGGFPGGGYPVAPQGAITQPQQ